jgi:hypothetical protein
MKNINLAWFLTLTFWPAIIANGWWVIGTCNLTKDFAVLVYIITALLSLLYLIVFIIRFLDELDG